MNRHQSYTPCLPQTSQIPAESACFYPRRSARYAETFFQEDASGWQAFKYGKLGEVIENIRTFALPFESKTYSFKMQYEYDSWNRIQRMTYPDGEVVSYGYNRGGMLESVLGNKNGVSSDYIKEIRYNKYELKDSVSYGNGTGVRYMYDSLLRLSHLRSACADGVMQDIVYTYDSVSNITNITNSAAMLPNGLGGAYSSSYEYDNLYRLANAEGSWQGLYNLSYHTGMGYFANGRVRNKKHAARTLLNGHSDTVNYARDYYYENPVQRNTLTRVVCYGSTGDYDLHYSWTPTGNMDTCDTEGAGSRRLCWDEQNRLQGVVDGKHLSYYLYDANGDRAFKLTGKGDLQNISGTWQYYYLLENATLYASPYLVATKQGYTKHYYAENERIVSKVGGGGLLDLDIPFVSQNLILRKQTASSKQALTVLEECLNARFFDVKTDLYTLYDMRDSLHPENDCYWYHTDHLGSSSWITYTDGSTVQHLLYLPWGEDFVDQRSTNWNAIFTFSAKERDSETGLSYFGSRYYSSDLSIWLSVDPMSAKYPSLSPYTYCANNPVRCVDPNGEDPIYAKNIWGKVKKIGDDGQCGSGSYLVRSNTARAVKAATKAGEFYTGDLSASDEVFHIPTGQKQKDVQTTVQNSLASGNSPNTRVEYGGHSIEGEKKARLWDPGIPTQTYKTPDGYTVNKRSVTPFRVNGVNNLYGGPPEAFEFIWHVHTFSSIPSSTDFSKMKNEWSRWFKGTVFIVCPNDNKVTFYNESRVLIRVKYDEFKKMGQQEDIP